MYLGWMEDGIFIFEYQNEFTLVLSSLSLSFDLIGALNSLFEREIMIVAFNLTLLHFSLKYKHRILLCRVEI